MVLRITGIKLGCQGRFPIVMVKVSVKREFVKARRKLRMFLGRGSDQRHDVYYDTGCISHDCTGLCMSESQNVAVMEGRGNMLLLVTLISTAAPLNLHAFCIDKSSYLDLHSSTVSGKCLTSRRD